MLFALLILFAAGCFVGGYGLAVDIMTDRAYTYHAERGERVTAQCIVRYMLRKVD